MVGVEQSPRANMDRTIQADPDEVAKFDALAATWWQPDGPMAPLHRLNPIRLAYARGRLDRHFGLDSRALRPLKGYRLLDVGCGGGLLSEPFARLGAEVTAIDASKEAIEVARAHAKDGGLDIDYRCIESSDLVAKAEQFDAVVCMEVLEHVADPAALTRDLVGLTRPGGLLLLSTLNRTPKSFALAIVGAEYLLRWVPKGTHDWRRFIRPAELGRYLRAAGARLDDVTGLGYRPGDDWRLARDTSVNYLASATTP